MKKFNKSRALLTSSILVALAGCSIDDYTPESVVNNNAPAHGGDIVLAYHEKATFTQVDLLGTTSGGSTGEGVATDADGNFLSVTDVVVTTSGNRTGDIGEAGIMLQGNKLGVRALDIAPNLDTDESHQVVVNYNVSDGVNKVPRMATLTFTGEDFAPEITGDLIANYTRDAGTSSLDALNNVVDADGETLVLSNLVASGDNPFDLPVTINGSNFDVDIAAVESSIADGKKETFNFTYTISDHNNDLTRNLVVNVLGVQDVAGAPLVLNYFKTDQFDETDNLKVYDLTSEIEDREGDDVVISELMLGGVTELPYGITFEGTNLSFNPSAFYDDIDAGQFKEFTFTYKVADSNGNVSDGTPELTLTVDGVESNLFKELGVDVGFENGGTGVSLFNCAAGVEYTDALVANGAASMQMLGDPCYVAIDAAHFPDLLTGQKYYFSYNAYIGSGDASPYIMVSNDPNGAHNFWVGTRPWHPANGTWRPLMVDFSTDSGYLATANGDGEKPTDIADQLQLFIMSAWMGNDGMPVFDDLNFTRYDNIEGVNVLNGVVEGIGFDDAGMALTTNGKGSVLIDVDPTDATNNVLMVDTTGADESPTVSFDIPKGAIVSGAKYVVSYDVQYVNFTANKDAGTDANINQWGGYRHSITIANGTSSFEIFNTIWSGAVLTNAAVVGDETSHWLGHGTDTSSHWDSDAITATIKFDGTNAQYIVDNVKIHRIP